MDIRTIVNEAKRGCGFRKAGGMYLITGGRPVLCGKLPVPLCVCPTCNQGIKPSRGWTWINLKVLLAGKECANENCTTFCRMYYPPEKVGLLWIGQKFYKTPEDFMAEGNLQGISRRITGIPKGFTVGEDCVCVAHREAIANPHPATDKEWLPGIFAMFRPDRIEYVVKGTETEEELEKLVKRGLSLVKLEWTNRKEEKTEDNATE